MNFQSPNHFGHYELIDFQHRKIPLSIISGTDFDMGKWYGKFLCDDIHTITNKFFKIFLHSNSNKLYGFHHEQEKNLLAGENLEKIIKNITSHTPKSYFDFIDGIKQGCEEQGKPIEDPLLFEKGAAIIEIGERQCSMFAAMPPFSSGHTYQLRDLDYYLQLGLQNNPSITVFIPQNERGEKNGIPYVNFGFSPLLGVITGMNAKGLCISQIRGNFIESSSLIGEPLTFIIQDILRNCETSEQAIEMLKQKKRATNHFIIISDPNCTENSINLIFSTAENVHVYPMNTPVNNDLLKSDKFKSYIPREGLVYWKQMEYLNNEPFPDEGPDVLDKLLQKYAGSLDAENGIEIAKQSGTIHTMTSAIFDLTTQEVWISFAHRRKQAQFLPYQYFDLKKYFAYANKLK